MDDPYAAEREEARAARASMSEMDRAAMHLDADSLSVKLT